MDSKHVYLFDLEATGLNLDDEFVIGGIKAFEDDCVVTTENIKEFIYWLVYRLKKNCPLSGHNIVSYDLPFLVYHEREMFGDSELMDALYEHPQCIWDTILISRRAYPRNESHKMEHWVDVLRGMYADCPKKVELDFEGAVTSDEWYARVEFDVLIQHFLTDHLVMKENLINDLENFTNIQKSLPFVIDMLGTGLPINIMKAKVINSKLEMEMKGYEEKLFKRAGKKFNLNSSLQIDKEIRKLYNEGLPLGEPSEKTGKVNPKINQKIQNYLENKFPFTIDIYKWRKAKGMKDYVQKKEGSAKSFPANYFFNNSIGMDCVHPKLSLFSSRTQRNQFSKPPLNQLSKGVREIIQAPDGWGMIGCDIEALEYRILAYTLKEGFDMPDLWNASEAGECVKKKTIEVFKDAFDWIKERNPDKDLMALAKTVNYATLYSSSAKSLSYETLGLPDEFVPFVENAMKERFPGMDILKYQLQDELESTGFLSNLFGVKVISPPYCSVNYYCQSSGTELALMLFGCLVNLYRKYFVDVRPIIHNHDEIQVLYKLENNSTVDGVHTTYALKCIKEELTKEFEGMYGYPLFVKLDFKIGVNWSLTH